MVWLRPAPEAVPHIAVFEVLTGTPHLPDHGRARHHRHRSPDPQPRHQTAQGLLLPDRRRAGPVTLPSKHPAMPSWTRVDARPSQQRRPDCSPAPARPPLHPPGSRRRRRTAAAGRGMPRAAAVSLPRLRATRHQAEVRRTGLPGIPPAMGTRPPALDSTGKRRPASHHRRDPRPLGAHLQMVRSSREAPRYAETRTNALRRLRPALP